MDVVLGRNRSTGELVRLAEQERLRGTYVVGTTGTGKSIFIESLALQDIQAGMGLCVLDPHGDLISRLVAQIPGHRLDDVVLLDPRDSAYPFGLNVFHCQNPSSSEEVSLVANHFVELIDKLWGPKGTEGTSWGPNIPMILRNTAFVLLANPGMTLIEVRSFLTDPVFRERCLTQVSNGYVRRFWADYEKSSKQEQRNVTSSTLNKIDEFVSQPIVANIVGQSQSTINFRHFMDAGKIVLVPLGLGPLGENVVNLLGSVIVLQCLNAALSRVDTPQPMRRQWNLYADEYQRFATPSFATLLTEARKFAVATLIATQVHQRLDVENQQAALNARNLVVFAVQGEDGGELARQFDRTPPPPEVVGQRPQLTISQDPVTYVLTHGHGDELVTFVCSQILKPLREQRDEHINLHDYKPESFRRLILHQDSVREGLQLIDAYLVDLMAQRFKPNSNSCAEAIVAIIRAMRERLRVAPEPSFLSPQMVHPDHVRGLLGRRDLPAGMLSALRKLALSRVTQREREIAVALDELKIEIAKADELPSYGTGFSHDPEHYRRIVDWLAGLGERLAERPILVASGEWEPILERTRSFLDMEHEIANRLVVQRHFEAWCRIVRDGGPVEFHVNTPRYRPVRLPGPFASKVSSNSRLKYTRPRSVVESEIDSRLASFGLGSTRRIVQL